MYSSYSCLSLRVVQVWEFSERNQLPGDGLKIQVKTGKMGMLPEKIARAFQRVFLCHSVNAIFFFQWKKQNTSVFNIGLVVQNKHFVTFWHFKNCYLKFRSPWIQNYSFLWISFHVTLISFQNLMSLLSLSVF